jgi:glycosyltransferase involved in cell wall biosynthesis
MTEPLISLILCVKDGMPYLPEAVASVVAQSFADYEVVVQDGSSADGSLEFLRTCADDPRFRIVSEPDAGVGDAFNRALRRCRGALVGSIDADNLLEPGALAAVVEAFRAQGDMAALYGRVRMIDAAGATLHVFDPPEFDPVALMTCELVPPFSTAFFARAVCGADLFFDPALKTCTDFDVWLRLSHQPIRKLPVVLGATRLSDKSMTCRPERYAQFCTDKLFALRRYASRRPQDPLLQAMRRHGEIGICYWAAYALFHLEGPADHYRGFREQLFALVPTTHPAAQALYHWERLREAQEAHRYLEAATRQRDEQIRGLATLLDGLQNEVNSLRAEQSARQVAR